MEVHNNVKNNKVHNFKQETDPKLHSAIQKSIDSVLMIYDEFHGTAVCISNKGHILTCHHCVDRKKSLKFITKKGDIIKAKLIFSDKAKDLALLQVQSQQQLSWSPIAEVQPTKGQAAFCIGNPGYDDLETKKSRKTGYLPFWVSDGKIKGYTEDQIYGDKKKGTGPLKHSCWTYWGHSGAPIFNQKGEVVGIHNSWDDQTAMRHGLGVQTIQTFLKQTKL